MTDNSPDEPIPPLAAREPAYSVNELADEADVTRRTVHYYIAQGLLPASGGEGRNSRYGRGHLDRLRLIRELQREHLPLSEIRQRLERLSDVQVADLLASGEHVREPRGSAFDYIQSVLAGTNRRASPLPPAPLLRQPPTRSLGAPQGPSPTPAPGPRPTPAPATAAAPGTVPLPLSPPTAAAKAPPPASEPLAAARSQWERIALAPDFELHVRRPLSRIQNRAVDKLVALARQLLEEDQP